MRNERRWFAAGVAICLAAVAAACAVTSPGVGFVSTTPPPKNPVICGSTPGQPWKDIGSVRDEIVLETSLPTGGSRRHVLVVPDGAVTSGTIRFSLRDAGYRFVAVKATSIPETVFVPRVMLTLSYAGCDTPVSPDVKMYRLVWSEQRWQWKVVPDYVHDPDNKTVTAPRDTLSEYALGAG